LTDTSSADPFDDIRALAGAAPGLDGSAMAKARDMRGQMNIRPDGLGRMGAFFDWLAGVSGRNPPTFRNPRLALYAARHGAADHDPLTPDAAHVRRHLELLAAGGGIANAFCASGDIGLQVFDLAPETPPGDPALGPAMTPRECAATIAFGMEALAGEVDLLCLSDISAGANFGAAAILEPTAMPLAWNGHRAAALADPLAALACLGGREIAAMVGAILAAAHQRIPVILDGMPAMAAAFVVYRLRPEAISHCLLAEARGADQVRFAKALGLEPVLNLDLKAGEGTAAALVVGLLRTALSVQLALPTRQRA
jgi:nicotinate-nucleotide--dimethylbenzimidazole phosphoribosyltransferase